SHSFRRGGSISCFKTFRPDSRATGPLSDPRRAEIADTARFHPHFEGADIGARRLHTIMEKLLEEISFNGPDLKKKNIKIDSEYVSKQLSEIVKDQDLSKYIL